MEIEEYGDDRQISLWLTKWWFFTLANAVIVFSVKETMSSRAIDIGKASRAGKSKEWKIESHS